MDDKKNLSLFKKLIITGFYTGYIKYLPGTAATFIGFLIYICLGQFVALYCALLLFFTICGFLFTKKAEIYFGKKDSEKITADEISGYMIGMLFFFPPDILYGIAGFALFRFFDILKPGIKRVQSLPHGYGVMLDDILAGIMTNLLLQLLRIILNN